MRSRRRAGRWAWITPAAALLGCPPAAPREPARPRPGIGASCAGADDCAAGETCCYEQLDATTFGRRCAPLASGACDGAEACAPGRGPCRTPNTSCSSDGRCVVTSRRVPCFEHTCEGATPVCCSSPEGSRCVATATDCGPEGAGAIACGGSADCAPGTHCCYDFKFPGARCEGTCRRATLCRTDADCAADPGTTCRAPYDRVPSGECQAPAPARGDEKKLFAWTIGRWLDENGVTLSADHWARKLCTEPIAFARSTTPALRCTETARRGPYVAKRLRIVAADAGALRTVLDVATDCWSDGAARKTADAALPLAPRVMLDQSWSKDDALTLSDPGNACADARALVAKHATNYEPGLGACLLAPCDAVGTWTWSAKAFVRRPHD